MVKVPAPQTQLKKEQPGKVSLEERIQKVGELKSQTLKRGRTIKTLHHIRTFSFASDDNCTLIISDNER